MISLHKDYNKIMINNNSSHPSKNKIVTFSFDDGVTQDKKLIDILDRYGAKCTFNINSGLFSTSFSVTSTDQKIIDCPRFDESKILDVYRNHEIGGHGLNHLSLTSLSESLAEHEIIEDKHNLEKLINKNISIFAYPYGDYNDDIANLLKNAGYKVARTVNSTYDFSVSENPLMLNPTCHYNDSRLMELAQEFVLKDNNSISIFYIWGHSYELDQYDNYDTIDKLLKYLSSYKDDILFMSNGEMINYLNDIHR